MDTKEKILIAGVGAIIAYLFLHRIYENEGKILNISEVVIYPKEFFV